MGGRVDLFDNLKDFDAPAINVPDLSTNNTKSLFDRTPSFSKNNLISADTLSKGALSRSWSLAFSSENNGDSDNINL